MGPAPPTDAGEPAPGPPPEFDLQAHSTRSDGALEPAEVVARAAAAGVRLLALSDHDTVEGVEPALAAAAEHGLRLVPAAEISAVDPAGQDLHILGYGLAHRDPALEEALAEFRADRGRRVQRMVDALGELGFAVEADALRARREAGRPIGRPHLAAAVVGHPGNAARLAQEGLAAPTDFLVAYLIEGAPAFRGREIPTVAQAIDTIHAAGGQAVWAHPFWDVSEEAEVLGAIDRFRAAGLDGVEAFYVTHSGEQVRLLAARCAQLGLLATGSSDFHGPEHPLFSSFRAHRLWGWEAQLGDLDG